MDTGYPALIPEPLDNHKTLKPSTAPSQVGLEKRQNTITQVDPISSPSTTEKIP